MIATGQQSGGAFMRPSITARNDCGEIIVPWGCVQLYAGNYEFVGQTGGDRAQTYFYVQKYDPASDAPVVFNGAAPVPVATGTIGYGTFQLARTVPVLALLNPDIALDDAWSIGLSPVENQFYLDIGEMFDFGGVFDSFGTYSETGFVLLRSDHTYLVTYSIVSVDDSDPADIQALCTVDHIAPTSATRVPEMDQYDQITVHDVNQCVFLESPGALANRKGWATYMRSPGGTKLWVALPICC